MRPHKLWLLILRVFCALLVLPAALCLIPLWNGDWPIKALYALIPAFLLANILPYIVYRCLIPARRGKRLGRLFSGLSDTNLRACAHGVEMLHIFLLSTAVSVTLHLARLPMLWQGRWKEWLLSAAIAIVAEAIVFWNGMLCLYLSSVELGLRWRIIGALCGLIPILQLVVLYRIMRIVNREIDFECMRQRRNKKRRAMAVCATKYPILLVHGVFFRDSARFNYWGRIPEELIENGATVYYGNQPAAASVRTSAHELAERIRELVAETGCEKLHVIAHSKGGLDMRAALAFEGIAPYVASFTTVNTPHRGCKFAEFLLDTAPETFRSKVAAAYNGAVRVWGDKEPDFLAAVRDLTAARCAAFNEETAGEAAHTEGIPCRSIHSSLRHATGGQFPLNCSYLIAKWFDGPNDGLVSEDSAHWFEDHTLITPTGKRGISHGDMIDLNRENIPGFDVREFYVQMVYDWKKKGL